MSLSQDPAPQGVQSFLRPGSLLVVESSKQEAGPLVGGNDYGKCNSNSTGRV